MSTVFPQIRDRRSTCLALSGGLSLAEEEGCHPINQPGPLSLPNGTCSYMATPYRPGHPRAPWRSGRGEGNQGQAPFLTSRAIGKRLWWAGGQLGHREENHAHSHPSTGSGPPAVETLDARGGFSALQPNTQPPQLDTWPFREQHLPYTGDAWFSVAQHLATRGWGVGGETAGHYGGIFFHL